MNNKQMEEDTIDLGKIASNVLEYKKEIVGIVGACTIVAGIYANVLPNEYESTTLVQTRSVGKDIGGLSAMAAAMGVSIGGSSGDSSENYMALMKTRRVLEPVIDSLEWEDEKSKPSAAGFAQKYLDIKNVKKTNLIQVTANGKTPEEAQKISQGVVGSFLAMQTDMNQQTQSLLVKFLNERIELAQKESEEAAANLAAYSKEHQIYSPDEQIKSALDQLNAYDKSIAEMEVDGKSAQAQYEIANSKLGDQKARSKEFRINDNTNVVSLRGEIVKKRVELVELTAKYTEENPEVIQARKDLQRLNNLLIEEVDTAVDSNVVSVNAIHDSILKDKVEAEVKMEATTASLDALRQKRSEKEQTLKNLPDGAMDYIKLKSDAELKQEVYLSLVKECEKDRVQEAMESMDIQIIDEANLPNINAPSKPKKKLIIMAGMLLGIVISCIYVIFKYRRNCEG